MRLRVVRVQLLERVADAPVQLYAPAGTEPVIDRVANQHIGEAKASRVAVHVGDAPLLGGLVQNVEKLFATYLAHALERGELELATEDRGESEDELGVVRETSQPPPNYCSHPFGEHPPTGLV